MHRMKKLIIVAILAAVSTNSYSQKKYSFDINPMAFYGISNTIIDPLLSRLEIFLNDIDGDIEHSAVVKYNKDRDDYDFSFLRGGNAQKALKQVLMVVEKVGQDKFLLKIAYLMKKPENVTIPAIVNVFASKEDSLFFFYPALYYYSGLMKTHVEGNIRYRYKDSLNIELCKEMNKINNQLARKFNVPPLKFTYYKFKNPKELFNCLGFDFLSNMYFDTTGGIVGSNQNAFYAGNNSEIYTHEIVHLYIRKLYTNANTFANEGFATLLGGSGETSYEQGILRIAQQVLSEKQDANIFEAFINDYQVDGKYSLKYFVGALVCKKVEDKYGMTGIKKLLCSGDTADDFLNVTDNLIGLNKENFNTEILSYLKGITGINNSSN